MENLPSTHPLEPIIYDYLNYRHFLKDFYSFLKAQKPIISYQYLSNKFQLGSHSHFYDICNGRNLTPVFFERYLKLLQFPVESDEANYFIQLVLYNQEKKESNRKTHFEKLVQYAPAFQTQVLKERSTEFYADFYNLMALNLIEIVKKYEIPFDNLTLPKALNLDELQKAFECLKRIQLIRWNEAHIQWETQFKHLSIKEDHKKFVLSNTHRLAMELGIHFYNLSYDQQKFSTLTLGVSASVSKKIDKAIVDLRARIVEWTKEDTEETDQVLQINFQKMTLYEK